MPVSPLLKMCVCGALAAGGGGAAYTAGKREGLKVERAKAKAIAPKRRVRTGAMPYVAVAATAPVCPPVAGPADPTTAPVTAAALPPMPAFGGVGGGGTPEPTLLALGPDRLALPRAPSFVAPGGGSGGPGGGAPGPAIPSRPIVGGPAAITPGSGPIPPRVIVADAIGPDSVPAPPALALFGLAAALLMMRRR